MDEETTPQEALKREILEETGLVVTVGDPFNVVTFHKDTGEFKIGISFLCDYVAGEVHLSQEHSEYQWIDPQAFQHLDSVPLLHEEISRYAATYGK